MGRWYEQARDTDFVFERGTCSFATYSVKDNGHVQVANSEKRNGKFTVANADATLHDDSGEGWLDVKFSKFSPAWPYEIMDTDYETYALIYGCGGVSSLFSVENVWIMTREPVASDELMAELEAKVAAAVPKYDQDKYFEFTHQGDDCDYPVDLNAVHHGHFWDAFLQQ